MNILAVCGFGVGSSMVLKMTIEKVLRKNNLKGSVENTDLSTAISSNADLILTSYELADDLRSKTDIPIYPIKRYMDEKEIENAINEYID